MRLLFAVACCLLAACGHNYEVELNEASRLMAEHPDSAYSILSSIDGQTVSRGRARARYALLYSQALDKNYIMVEDDSLIQIARDYYSRSNDIKNRFLSEYYYGLVLYNRHEGAPALINLLKIEQDGQKLHDSYMLGMLYHQISEIYSS